MALVKCTKEIKSHVTAQIDELFKGRIKKAYELKGITELEVAEEVYSRIFTLNRVKAMQEITAEITGNFKLLFDSKEFTFTVKLAAGTERKIAINWANSRQVLAQFTSAYNAPEISQLTAATGQAIIEASARRQAVVKERENFKADFNRALEQVKSVNELIKLWPAVVELLPEGTMDRINRKTGPRIKTEEVFDAAALNVQLLKAKVAK